DLSSPRERLSFILNEARSPLLLTHARLLDRLPTHQAQTLCLDTEWESIAQQSKTNPQVEMTADHLAYIVYTSGSTGTPKGVMVPHRGLVNYLSWCANSYPMIKDCGVPLHSSISFDLAVTSLYLPLISGHYVDLLDEHSQVDALNAVWRENIE